MKVIYPIRAALVALYIEFLRNTFAMFAAESVSTPPSLHSERKADENALAVNNVGRGSEGAHPRLQGNKINLTSFHPPVTFSASCASHCPRPRLATGWKHPDREWRWSLRKLGCERNQYRWCKHVTDNVANIAKEISQWDLISKCEASRASLKWEKKNSELSTYSVQHVRVYCSSLHGESVIRRASFNSYLI